GPALIVPGASRLTPKLLLHTVEITCVVSVPAGGVPPKNHVFGSPGKPTTYTSWPGFGCALSGSNITRFGGALAPSLAGSTTRIAMSRWAKSMLRLIGSGPAKATPVTLNLVNTAAPSSPTKLIEVVSGHFSAQTPALSCVAIASSTCRLVRTAP